MKKLTALTGITLTAIALAGCAVESGVQSAPTSGVNAPATVPDVPTPTSAAPSVLKFGDTFTYENGLVMTVSAPTSFTPSEWNTVDGATDYLRFDVTIVNGTPTVYDPSTFMASLQNGNVEAEQIFDSNAGLGGSPSTDILPGRETTFPIGFAITYPGDLVLEATAGWQDAEGDYVSYDKAYFTSPEN